MVSEEVMYGYDVVGEIGGGGRRRWSRRRALPEAHCAVDLVRIRRDFLVPRERFEREREREIEGDSERYLRSLGNGQEEKERPMKRKYQLGRERNPHTEI